MLTRFYNWVTSWEVVRVLLWILHFLVVAAAVFGLWYVNRLYAIETDLLSPFTRLHPYWLPILFLLVYAGAWLGYWFFKLLTDPRTGEYPDIDDAWSEGMAALDAAGIDPREVPLILVVGTPRTGPADFFAATKLPFAVRGEPRRPDAPVKVYATRDAVFVTCEGASSLARFAFRLASQPVAASVPVRSDPAGANLLDSPAAPVSVMSGEAYGTAMVAEPSTKLESVDDVWLPVPTLGVGTTLATDERELYSRRLGHLCGLIAERRAPYCPANGVVWLVPLAATASDALADQAAVACRSDALAAEAGLQVYCPAAAVVCDAEDLPGFRDLLRGLPETLARERLLGRSFPLVPGGPAEQRPMVLHSGIDWVARHLVPGVAYQRFGSEAEGNGERWSAANARLWTLTAELHDRRGALARVIAQGIADAGTRPPMLAGVYLVGTGPDEQDRAFAAGVIQQLLSLQNNVAWTDAADAEEADYRRMTVIGYAATLALVVAVVVFGVMTWRR